MAATTQPAANQSLTATQLYLDIFGEKMAIPSKKGSIVSGVALNTGFTVSDVTWTQRGADDLGNLIQAYKPSAGLSFLGTPSASVAYNAFGVTTAANAWIGPLSIANEVQNIAHAEKIGDSKGALLGRISVVQNMAATAGGVCFLGYRPLAIACSVLGISYPSFNAPTLLGSVTYGLVTIGIALFTVLYLIIAVSLGIKAYQGEMFRNKLKGSEDEMGFLINRITANAADSYEKLLKKYGNDENKLKKALEKEAIAYGADVLKQRFNNLSLKKCESLIKKIAEKANGDLELIGLNLKTHKWQLKKEAKLARLTSSECVKLIKETLAHPTDSSLVTKTLEKVHATLDAKRNTYIFVALLCILGAGLMTAGIFVTGGVGAIVIAAAMLAVCVVMYKLDRDDMNSSLQNEMPGRFDKGVVIASSALCLTSFATVVGLMAAGLIAVAAYPLIITLVLSVIWLAYNRTAWNSIHEKERKWKQQHPTLENMLDLSKKQIEKRWEKMAAEEKAALMTVDPTKTFSNEKLQEAMSLLKEESQKDEEEYFASLPLD